MQGNHAEKLNAANTVVTSMQFLALRSIPNAELTEQA